MMDDLEEIFGAEDHYKDRPMSRVRVSNSSHKHLYIVRHLDTGAIKIGRSANPQKRLNGLKKTFGGRMVLVGMVADAGMDEKILHKNLSAWALGKEWFSPSFEVLQTVLICLTEGATAAVDFSDDMSEHDRHVTPA